MAHARKRDDWDHTSVLLSMTANAHRDPKKTRPFHPRDFNPYAGLDKPVERIENLGVLRDQFPR